jgi:hypothetical protein
MKHEEPDHNMSAADLPTGISSKPLQIARRRALLSIVGGVSALASCSSTHTSDGKDDTGEALLNDLHRLSGRAYSEEGIPVFLLCENLAATEGFPVAEAGFVALAAKLAHYAELLPRVRRNLSEDDVPKLMELLADQDFGVRKREANE